MKEMTRIEGVRSEAAILVGVILPDLHRYGDPIEELEGLAETAGARVVGRLTQRRHAPDRTTYLGKGKLEELGFKQLAAENYTLGEKAWILNRVKTVVSPSGAGPLM